MFVSASRGPAHNITSTCLPLVRILSHGCKLTAEGAGACDLPVCPRRQNSTETTDHYGATAFNTWTPCPPATATVFTAVTFNALRIRTGPPNTCCQASGAFSLHKNATK